jgi:hypothetical protein
MTHTAIRLEQGGTVVAYLAPASQITPVSKNDLFAQTLAHGRGAVARDVGRWYWEVTIQGTFQHSDNLPEQHRIALEDLFGLQEVTAEMQMRRIYQYAVGVGGNFDLYTPQAEYTARDETELRFDPAYPGDILRLPQVAFDEIRGPYVAGKDRVDFMLKFISGFSREEEEEEEEE